MNDVLFDPGIDNLPPIEERIKVLLWGRANLPHSEDKWTSDDLCLVRAQLPKQWHSIDLVVLKNRLMQDRKDKRCPKVKPPREFTERFEKLIRDFGRNQERLGNERQSETYVNYINSEEWRSVSREHKERCNWRCQLCGKPAGKLDVHHTSEGYNHLGKEMPWHVLALCDQPCHPFADMVREGWMDESGGAFLSLFDEDDIE